VSGVDGALYDRPNPEVVANVALMKNNSGHMCI
jgi:hypothetical protein